MKRKIARKATRPAEPAIEYDFSKGVTGKYASIPGVGGAGQGEAAEQEAGLTAASGPSYAAV